MTDESAKVWAERPPLPPQLRGVEVIMGGVWDNRPPEEWLPSDGLKDTALRKSGKPLGRVQCCARKKKTQGGARCTQAVERDSAGNPWKKHCRWHGGTRELPLIHGEKAPTARYFNGKTHEFAKKVRAFTTDSNLLDNASNIALIDAHIQEVLEARVEEKDSPGFRKEAVRLFNAMRRANDETTFQAGLQTLGRFLRQGWSRDRALLEVHSLSERRSSIADKQRRREIEEELTFSQAVVASAFDKILSLITSHVPNNYSGPCIDAITRELVGGTGPVLPMPRREADASEQDVP